MLSLKKCFMILCGFPLRLHYMIRCSDEGYLLAGQTSPGSTGTQDAWLVKLDSLGCIFTGCTNTIIQENWPVNSISDFSAFQNQFGNTIEVSFYAYGNEKGNIQLIDITGRTLIQRSIQTLVGLNKHKEFTGELSPGIYLIRILTGTGAITRKMILE